MNKTVQVDLGERGYDIYIGEKWLKQLPAKLSSISTGSQHILITDRNVFQLAGANLLAILKKAGFIVEPAVVEEGEINKNLATVESLYEQMVKLGLDRGSAVFALGGGIVGDIAGFAAATYMRGINYVQIPTTLLAQVDSSVGGKTGVNLPWGKNLVGAFYQPRLVFIDLDFLMTLPEKEYLTGLAEVIKYGIIADSGLFSYLENNLAAIKARNLNCLLEIVPQCCAIKAGIVADDEREQGLRSLLNLGHTFGHAFEALTEYRVFTHGEAVAIGIICAAKLAKTEGLISSSELSRIILLIQNYGLPTSYGDLESSDIIKQMYKDKKSFSGILQIVLPTGIGESRLIPEISEEKIIRCLADNK